MPFGQCTICASPHRILSVIKKYLMFICRVLLPLKPLPLFSSFIVLWLSWFIMLAFTTKPCASKKKIVHRIWGIRLSTATNLASVELLVFNFCFVPPVWLKKSWWTPNAASTHQVIVELSSHLRVSTRSFVPRKYLITLFNFCKSYFSGPFTRVVEKAAPVQISGRPHLQRKCNCATMWWNCSVSIVDSDFAISYILNTFSAAGVTAVASHLSDKCASSWRIWLMYCRMLIQTFPFVR